MGNRDDFSKEVKELLAKRAGYRCSNPKCRKITIGANSNPTKATNIGVAAHICAAAPGGPRFSDLMTKEERKAADNGIWLCQSCSVLIDRDVELYPVECLMDWKKSAEKESLREVNGIPFSEEDLTIIEDDFDYDIWEEEINQKSKVMCDITALIAACRRLNSWDDRSELKLYSWLNNHFEDDLAELQIDELVSVRQSVLDYFKLHIEMDEELLHATEDDFTNDLTIFEFVRNHPGYTCAEIAHANRITISAAKRAIENLVYENKIVEVRDEESFDLKLWIRKF